MAVRKTKKASPKKTATVADPAPAASTAAAPVPHQRVAERAYQIWEVRGCPHGEDFEHWLQAELELRGARAAMRS